MTIEQTQKNAWKVEYERSPTLYKPVERAQAVLTDLEASFNFTAPIFLIVAPHYGAGWFDTSRCWLFRSAFSAWLLMSGQFNVVYQMDTGGRLKPDAPPEALPAPQATFYKP